MIVGYARVSTPDQSLDPQLDELRRAGCEKLFSDVACGARAARPGLDEALRFLRSGDTLIAWSLDRVGRTTRHLLKLVEQLEERHIELRLLKQGLLTGSAANRMVLTVLAALGEFERELIRERTRSGLDAARARGRKGGRPSKLSEKDLATIATLRDSNHSVREICRLHQVAPSTLYRTLHRSKNLQRDS